MLVGCGRVEMFFTRNVTLRATEEQNVVYDTLDLTGDCHLNDVYDDTRRKFKKTGRFSNLISDRDIGDNTGRRDFIRNRSSQKEEQCVHHK